MSFGASWTVDATQIDRLMEAATIWPRVSEDAINEVLHGEGATLIGESIDQLVPESGRRFKGHTSGAKGSNWQSYDMKNLSVTVAARGKRGYLYFPDDGTNTRRHAGNQQFFRRGAEAATDDVVDLCVDEMIMRMEG